MSSLRRPLAGSLGGELLAAAVTVAALASSVRLFEGASFLIPVIGSALLSHLLAAVTRRAGGSLALGVAFSLIATAALQLWLHYPHTTWYGIPQRATLTALGEDFRAAWDLLVGSSVPLPEQTGLIVAAAAVAWLLAVLGDWAAFRVGGRGEALAPAAILLVLVAMFGTGDGTILYPAITVGCAVAFALVHARARTAARLPTVESKQRHRWYLPGGLLAGAIAVGAGTLITAVLLPSLTSGPLRSLLDGEEPAAPPARQIVLSPLVALPGQLQQNPELELFTVWSTERSYWRLTALGDFNGLVWSLEETTGTVTGSLPTLEATSGPVSQTTQSYQIGALAAVWLPAAYQPMAFETSASSFTANFEPISSTLLVSSGRRNADGLRYTVQSAVPRFDPAFLGALRNDPAAQPPGFLELPENLDPSLRELATAVTAGRDGPYNQALALQNWFRQNFSYDLGVSPGHSSDRLETFLFNERRGYCEQFAGAFATLARTLGLPARVAVGFTPGIALETGTDDRVLYSVRGKHAHAWPEIFISGAGWVAFEPTPGRGAPGAETYTLVAEQQDSSTEDSVPDSTPPPVANADPSPGPPTSDPPIATPSDSDGSNSGATHLAIRIGQVAGLVAAALALIGAVYVTTTAALRHYQQRRRRRWAGSDTRRNTLVAWEEILELLRSRQLRPRPSETPLELGLRAARLLGPAPDQWQHLAFCTSVAAFAGDPLPANWDQKARTAATAITTSLTDSLTPAMRLRRMLDPYPWKLLRLPGYRQRHSGLLNTYWTKAVALRLWQFSHRAGRG